MSDSNSKKSQKSPPKTPPSHPVSNPTSPTNSSRKDQFFTPLNPSHLRKTTFPSGSGSVSPDEPSTSHGVDRRDHERESLIPSQSVHNKNDNRYSRPSYGATPTFMTDGGLLAGRDTWDQVSVRSMPETENEIGDLSQLQATATTIRLPKWFGSNHRERRIYIAYYIPFFNWIKQYKLSYLRGDFIAALTMASFYIPMALSYASSLGHIPSLNGLYAFVFNPLIYALLGTCPQMVVGPEAPGSLLIGQVVRANADETKTGDELGRANAELAGLVTFTAGLIILLAGLFRLGFLDNVLSRPFQRGFISAIGIVILIGQLIPELGLSKLADEAGDVLHGSCIDQIVFLTANIRNAHVLTAAVSLGSFTITMVLRELKNHLQPKHPSVAYIPDRFLIVIIAGFLSWGLRWDQKGLEILGDTRSGGRLFPIHVPYSSGFHFKYAADTFGTSFIIALLGFFESSVAAKSLEASRKTAPTIQNLHVSANRELVALGSANVLGGIFMAIPAFGGYGRSKLNASTGGRTPMSSIFLSLITLLCALFLTPYFYYLPKGVLSSMISVVAYSLLEELPPDLLFFIRIRGFSELLLMTLIFVSTIFWDLKVGIAVGIGLSLLRVIHHATRPRIQILGRVPGTDRFENAERNSAHLEFFEGCLIVKIPEPLTFANTGSLRARLQRLERYGEAKLHPSHPPRRSKEHNKNLIFDVHGVTSLDGAGAQVLRDIVQTYTDNDVRVIFCRAPRVGTRFWQLLSDSGVVDLVGGPQMFVNDIHEALALTEVDGATPSRASTASSTAPETALV